jgi:hypothetical protein
MLNVLRPTSGRHRNHYQSSFFLSIVIIFKKYFLFQYIFKFLKYFKETKTNSFTAADVLFCFFYVKAFQYSWPYKLMARVASQIRNA